MGSKSTTPCAAWIEYAEASGLGDDGVWEAARALGHGRAMLSTARVGRRHTEIVLARIRWARGELAPGGSGWTSIQSEAWRPDWLGDRLASGGLRHPAAVAAAREMYGLAGPPDAPEIDGMTPTEAAISLRVSSHVARRYLTARNFSGRSSCAALVNVQE
jgi:hypothetical protein